MKLEILTLDELKELIKEIDNKHTAEFRAFYTREDAYDEKNRDAANKVSDRCHYYNVLVDALKFFVKEKEEELQPKKQPRKRRA